MLSTKPFDETTIAFISGSFVLVYSGEPSGFIGHFKKNAAAVRASGKATVVPNFINAVPPSATSRIYYSSIFHFLGLQIEAKMAPRCKREASMRANSAK
jgi:hypothetical protein